MENGSMYDSPSTPEPEEPATGGESKDEGPETALLPKSVFKNKDLKVGDKEQLEVVHIYSDEVEVRCIYEKKEKPERAEAQIDSMAALNE